MQMPRNLISAVALRPYPGIYPRPHEHDRHNACRSKKREYTFYRAAYHL